MNDRTNGAESAQSGNPDQTEQTEQADQAEQAEPSIAKQGGSRAQERIAALDTSGAALTEELEQLAGELQIAEQRAAETEAGWQRARADFANLKRRTEEERTELAGMASDRLLIRVVELADDFDLAIEHVPEEVRDTPWAEGVSAIDRKLRALLEAEGIVAMEGEGQPFDPQSQQAISYEDTEDVPDGTVTKVLQRGYSIRDRVLRPALVAVARNEDDTTTQEND